MGLPARLPRAAVQQSNNHHNQAKALFRLSRRRRFDAQPSMVMRPTTQSPSTNTSTVDEAARLILASMCRVNHGPSLPSLLRMRRFD